MIINVLRVFMVIMIIMVIMVLMVIMVIMVIMAIMDIRVIRITSVKSSMGIITHQGHISQVNTNDQSVTLKPTSLLERIVTLKIESPQARFARFGD